MRRKPRFNNKKKNTKNVDNESPTFETLNILKFYGISDMFNTYIWTNGIYLTWLMWVRFCLKLCILLYESYFFVVVCSRGKEYIPITPFVWLIQNFRISSFSILLWLLFEIIVNAFYFHSLFMVFGWLLFSRWE